MLTGINWFAFVPAAVLASLVPGANQLLSLRNAMRQGTVDATVALLGRFSAFALLIGLVVLGFGTLLAESAVAFGIAKWIGVGYLCWLGISTLCRAWREGDPAGSGDRSAQPSVRGRWALTRQEFVVALTNPKALLLFAAFIPQFVATPTPSGAQLALLGAAYIGIEAVAALVYTVVGGRLARLGFTSRIRRRVDQICGVTFLGMAGYLGFDLRPAAGS